MNFERPLKKKISVSLDTNVLENIQLLAIENDRSLSQYINRILRLYISSIEEETQK